MNFLTFRIQSLIGSLIIIFALASLNLVYAFYQKTISEIDNLSVASTVAKIKKRNQNLKVFINNR